MKSKLRLAKAISAIAMLTAVASVLALTGCSTVSVTTDHDHTVNFEKYRTYAVEPPPNAPALSPSADTALRSTLNQSLAAKGLREVELTNSPDLAVVPHIRTQQKYSVDQYTSWGYGPDVWPYYGGHYGMWYGAPYTYSTINSYTEGTLILDFVDTSNQKLVFRGTGKATVSDEPEANAEKIREAVEKIVAKLPVTGVAPVAGHQSSTTESLSR